MLWIKGRRSNAAREERRAFAQSLAALVVPIALQNLLSASVSLTDVVVLGAVSQEVMSAVSLAGQVTFILSLFYFGLSTGAGILAAQYWGRKDQNAIQQVLSIACSFSSGVSVLFFALALFAPVALMHLFTPDAVLVFYGARYLKAVSFSYLAAGLSQMYLSVAKSMENARLSAWISSGALLLDLLLSALCVFVLFPRQPEKAVTGIAVTTVIARLAELLCCFAHTRAKGSLKFRLPARTGAARQLLRDFLKYTAPVQANYLVWGVALAATSAIVGHRSADMVAANSVASVVKNLATALCGGIAGGGAVLVGKYLGSGDLAAARRAGDRLVFYALLFGAAAGLTVLLVKPLAFLALRLAPPAAEYLDGMFYIAAYYCVGKSLNSTVIGGIFCAGGDSRFGFLCDTVAMWGVILPLSYLCAFVWHVEPVFLYAVISLDETVKLPAALIRYRKYKWLNDVTRDLTAL